MPLTRKGKEILKGFKKEYGDEQGESIFYAYMNENPFDTEEWHRDVGIKDIDKKINKILKGGK